MIEAIHINNSIWPALLFLIANGLFTLFLMMRIYSLKPCSTSRKTQTAPPTPEPQKNETQRPMQEEDPGRTSEIQFRAVLESVVDGIITIDSMGHIESFNPAAEKMFGYEKEEILGQNVNMLMPSPYHENHDRYLQTYLKTRKANIIGISREALGKRKDKSTFPVELSVSEMNVNGKIIFTGILRDISYRKEMDKLKEEFVSMVSHELRTPLTSIKGSLGLLCGGVVGDLPMDASNLLDIAYNNTDRLLTLINDILDLSKIESGKMEFKPAPISIAVFLDKALKANEPYGEHLEVHFRITDNPAGIKVFVDEDRLMQVMFNLISNAAKFSPPGSYVEIGANFANKRVRIFVKDYGPGIPDEFRDRIFQKFSQVDSSDQRKKGGTGLGLSIAKSIVEYSNGHLSFASKRREGTTFFIDLPAWEQPDMQLAEKIYNDDFKKILICEDDLTLAQLLSEWFSKNGFATAIAGNSELALQKLNQTRYDALTLDLALPGKQGIDFVKDLRQHGEFKQLPIIIISGTADEAQKAHENTFLKITEWIGKPIDYDRLSDTLITLFPGTKTPKPSILHIEDDSDLCKVVRMILKDRVRITQVPTLFEARKILEESDFDLILLDVNLPDGCGLDLIEERRAGKHFTKVLVFSADDIAADVMEDLDGVLIKSRTSNEELIQKIEELIQT